MNKTNEKFELEEIIKSIPTSVQPIDLEKSNIDIGKTTATWVKVDSKKGRNE